MLVSTYDSLLHWVLGKYILIISEHPDLIISLFKLYHPMSIEMTKFDKKLLEMHVEVNFVRAPGHYVVVKFILQLNVS